MAVDYDCFFWYHYYWEKIHNKMGIKKARKLNRNWYIIFFHNSFFFSFHSILNHYSFVSNFISLLRPIFTVSCVIQLCNWSFCCFLRWWIHFSRSFTLLKQSSQIRNNQTNLPIGDISLFSIKPSHWNIGTGH